MPETKFIGIKRRNNGSSVSILICQWAEECLYPDKSKRRPNIFPCRKRENIMFYFIIWLFIFAFFFAIEYILGNIVYLIFIDLLKFSAPNPIICSCIFNFILGIVANVLLS